MMVAATAWFIAPSPNAYCADEQPAVSSVRDTDFGVIGLEEFRQVLTSNGGIIVDTRPEDEYATGHVPGAVNVPRYKVVTSLSEVEGKLSRERLLVLYCGGPDCEDAEMEARALRKLLIFRKAKGTDDGKVRA